MPLAYQDRGAIAATLGQDLKLFSSLLAKHTRAHWGPISGTCYEAPYLILGTAVPASLAAYTAQSGTPLYDRPLMWEFLALSETFGMWQPRASRTFEPDAKKVDFNGWWIQEEDGTWGLYQLKELGAVQENTPLYQLTRILKAVDRDSTFDSPFPLVFEGVSVETHNALDTPWSVGITVVGVRDVAGSPPLGSMLAVGSMR